MDIGLIRTTLSEMAPLGTYEVIPTTMGEPLMYKELPELIELCKVYRVKMNLTTNGSFFGRGASWWAERIVPVTSDVKISWNGATTTTQQMIMKNSDLDKQKGNLKIFIKERDRVASEGGNYCSVTLQLTFMDQNLGEILDVVKFAKLSGCDRVKGHHLWAHFPEIKDQNLRRSNSSILEWNKVATECRNYTLAHPLPNGKLMRLDNFDILPINSSDSNINGSSSSSSSSVHPEAVCPFLGKEAWINHEGRFDPCCAPDEQRKSLGYFGNINTPGQNLMKIWSSDAYKELCRDYLMKPLCRECTMRRPPLEVQ
jgi:MoaA/NifB/PqqE/SkfB family radical SAM enzyme